MEPHLPLSPMMIPRPRAGGNDRFGPGILRWTVPPV